MVHWSPFVMSFKKKYPWIQLAGHAGSHTVPPMEAGLLGEHMGGDCIGSCLRSKRQLHHSCCPWSLLSLCSWPQERGGWTLAESSFLFVTKERGPFRAGVL